jgi:hypothetical protein
MLFCSVPAVAAVGIVITMTAKVTNGVGTTAATMLGARKGARWGGHTTHMSHAAKVLPYESFGVRLIAVWPYPI